MRRGEVWWVDFDPSVGGETRKTRPALIVSKATDTATPREGADRLQELWPGAVALHTGATGHTVLLSDLRCAAPAARSFLADGDTTLARAGCP